MPASAPGTTGLVENTRRTLGARFSVTVRTDASVKAAIAAIADDGWTPIRYPRAVRDEEGRCWISDAEIAGVPYTAFTSKPSKQQVTARPIVRRVKRLNTGAVLAGQGTLFDTWRHHAAFTDSPLSLNDAERDQLINVPARLARSARRLTLHLPDHWPWRQDFTQLFSTVHAPPAL